jgi:arylsulfatase A-like enzyme
MSCYGYPSDTTPFKKQLFENGFVFDYAFSQATKTRPSVPSIMTSLYPTATGVWRITDRLDDAYLTIAEIMRNQGFATAAFIQNQNAGPYAGIHQGFGQLTSTAKATPEHGYGKLVRDWIESHRHRNFFLYLHVLDPHGKYDPPESHRGWWKTRHIGGHPVDPDRRFDPDWVSTPTIEGRRARYDGEIRNNDDQFKGFVTWLKEQGLYEDTLLVFISDHGEFLGEHGLWEHTPPGFIQVLRVPLLINYPRLNGLGTRIRHPVQLIDVMPTILDLAQIDTEPLILHGQSLIPLIENQQQQTWSDRVIASDEVVRRSSPADAARGSLFFGQWHLLYSQEDTVRIFDYVHGPDEGEVDTSRFAAELAKLGIEDFIATIQSANITIWQSLVKTREPSVEYDANVIDQLRELGYVE